MAISLAFLFPSSSAISSTIDIPKSMQSTQELEVVVTAPDEGDYDIKIFFEYQETIVASEVLTSEGWQNSHYYIQDINFKERTFNIKLQYPDKAQTPLSLCVRLRKADSTSTPQKQCLPIEVGLSSSESKDSQEKQTVLSPIVSRQVSQPIQENSSKSNLNSTTINIAEDNSPIILSSKKVENSTAYTSQGKSKILINYLIALAVLITLFIVVRSEIKHREI
jgi:hypothetical protein